MCYAFTRSLKLKIRVWYHRDCPYREPLGHFPTRREEGTSLPYRKHAVKFPPYRYELPYLRPCVRAVALIVPTRPRNQARFQMRLAGVLYNLRQMVGPNSLSCRASLPPFHFPPGYQLNSLFALRWAITRLIPRRAWIARNPLWR